MRRRIVSLALLVTTAACQASTEISSDAVAYNTAVENAHDEMLLLNVVRAMRQEPMHFTAVSQVRGNTTRTVEMDSQFPIGGGAPTVFTITPKGTYSENPSFDVAVLDSQNFMNGILSPVSMKTIKYYFDQGWPVDVLLYLFVRKIEMEKDGNVVESHWNYPLDPRRFEDFEGEVRWLTCDRSYLRLLATEKSEKIGPPMSGAQFDLKSLVAADKNDLDVERDEKGAAKPNEKGEYQLVKSSLKYSFERTDSKDPKKKKVAVHLKLITAKDAITPGREVQNEELDGAARSSDTPARASTAEERKKQAEERHAKDTDLEWKLYVRSPEAILYYLGELMRAQTMFGLDTTPKVQRIVGCDQGGKPRTEEIPLFLARATRDDDKDPLVVVKHRGTKYLIPSEPSHSMHCLTLLSQVFALQKTSDELKTTAAVTVVGAK